MTAVSLGFAVCLALPATPSLAAGKPDVKALQKKLNTLNTQVDLLTEKYDKSQEDLKQAQKQVTVYDQQIKAEQSTYTQLHEAVAQMAASAYKTSGSDDTAMGSLMSAKDPSSILQQMSVITAVSKDRTSKLSQFVASAQRLQRFEDQAKAAIVTVRKTQADIAKQKTTLQAQIKQQVKLLREAGGPVPGQGTCKIQLDGTPAGKAIAFACSKLGTPYLWGGTGPRYDCSGLTQAAWAAAGISLPRTAAEQFTAFKRVGYSQLQPGDLVFFESGIGHVGIYLGGGRFVHSPHTGDVVKISDITTGFYRSEFQGGVHIA
jgi:cell wall-associated NlpC family hydrolase